MRYAIAVLMLPDSSPWDASTEDGRDEIALNINMDRSGEIVVYDTLENIILDVRDGLFPAALRGLIA